MNQTRSGCTNMFKHETSKSCSTFFSMSRLDESTQMHGINVAWRSNFKRIGTCAQGNDTRRRFISKHYMRQATTKMSQEAPGSQNPAWMESAGMPESISGGARRSASSIVYGGNFLPASQERTSVSWPYHDLL